MILLSILLTSSISSTGGREGALTGSRPARPAAERHPSRSAVLAVTAGRKTSVCFLRIDHQHVDPVETDHLVQASALRLNTAWRSTLFLQIGIDGVKV